MTSKVQEESTVPVLNWSQRIIQSLDSLRRGGRLCDVHLLANDGEIFPAHAVVLAAASEVWQTCISELFASGHAKCWALQTNISSQNLSLVLRYLYTGTSDVEGELGEEALVKTLVKLSEVFETISGDPSIAVKAKLNSKFSGLASKQSHPRNGSSAQYHQPEVEYNQADVRDAGQSKTSAKLMARNMQDHSSIKVAENLPESSSGTGGGDATAHLNGVNICDVMKEWHQEVCDSEQTTADSILALHQLGESQSHSTRKGQFSAKQAVLDKSGKLLLKQETETSTVSDDTTVDKHLADRPLRSRRRSKGAQCERTKFCTRSVNKFSKQKVNSYQCCECDLRLMSVRSLTRHCKAAHGMQVWLMTTCSVCGKVLRSNSSLVNHMKTHSEPKYECSWCCKRFTFKCGLDRHLETHTGIRKNKRIYVCEDCGKEFTSASTFSGHKFVHGPRIFKCEICSKQFKAYNTWKIHSKRCRGDKPHKCQYCSYCGVTKCDLKYHMRIHTGERLFECPVCHDKFVRKATMEKHVHRKHKGFNQQQTVR